MPDDTPTNPPPPEPEGPEMPEMPEELWAVQNPNGTLVDSGRMIWSWSRKEGAEDMVGAMHPGPRPVLVGVHPRFRDRATAAEAEAARLHEDLAMAHRGWQSEATRLASERNEAVANVERLKEEARRFYLADGSFTLLATPEEAIRMRVACAQMIKQFQEPTR